MRRTYKSEVWEQLKTAVAGGLPIRELARNAGIPEGTALARSKREGWTQQIAVAKVTQQPKLARELAKPEQNGAITPMQSVAATMQQRGERYVNGMAGVAEKVLPHIGLMEPAEILDGMDSIEKFDRVSRRTFGLSDGQPTGGALSLSILTNLSVVQEIAKPS